MNRKLRRSMRKHTGQESTNDVAEKMFLFDKMPNKCDICENIFDKKDADMVQTWKVIVKEQEKIVRLFCPSCYGRAEEAIKNGSTNNRAT